LLTVEHVVVLSIGTNHTKKGIGMKMMESRESAYES